MDGATRYTLMCPCTPDSRFGVVLILGGRAERCEQCRRRYRFVESAGTGWIYQDTRRLDPTRLKEMADPVRVPLPVRQTARRPAGRPGRFD